MTNIDTSMVITAAAKAGEQAARRAGTVKQECRRRILAVADATAQINLAAAAAADALSADQLATYKAGLTWIMTMRATAASLAADPAADHTDDAAWPAVPPGAVDLADAF